MFKSIWLNKNTSDTTHIYVYCIFNENEQSKSKWSQIDIQLVPTRIAKYNKRRKFSLLRIEWKVKVATKRNETKCNKTKQFLSRRFFFFFDLVWSMERDQSQLDVMIYWIYKGNECRVI